MPAISLEVERLWIVGGSGAALQVWAILQACKTSSVALCGFIVKEPPGFDVEDLQVITEADFLARADPSRDNIVLGVGNPRRRETLAAKFKAAGIKSCTVIHPLAVIGPNVQIGSGCVVMPNAILETHVRLGEHVFINLAACVAHECRIGSFTNLGPHACLAGGSSLGRRCDLGAGVVCRPRIRLGDDVLVGAGAVVVADWRGPTRLVGIPAKPLVD